MKKCKKLLTTLLFSLSFLFLQAWQLDDIQLNKIKAQVDKDLQISGAPGAVIAVVQNGNLLLQEAIGLSNSKTKDSVSKATLFLTASVTKSVTTAALLTVCHHQGIDMQTKVKEFLPDLPKDIGNLSLHQILSQSSGILDHWPTRKKFMNNGIDYFQRYGDVLVNKSLQGVFSYTNFGHALAGLILSKLLETSFEQAMDSIILNPLNMSATTYNIDSARLHDYSAAHKNGKKVKHVYTYPLIRPSASMFSNVADLAKFATCLMNEGRYKNQQVIPKEVIMQMSTGYTPLGTGHNYFGYPNSYYNYSLISFQYKGISFVGHPGESTTQNTLFAMAKDHNTAFIIMSNTGFYPFIETFELLVESFLPTEHASQKRDSTETGLSDYTGTYYTPDIFGSKTNTVEIFQRNNDLLLQLDEEMILSLKWLSEDRFCYETEQFKFPVELIFYRDEMGQVQWLNHFWKTAVKM